VLATDAAAPSEQEAALATLTTVLADLATALRTV
jgi:hypothetical protein